MLYRNEKMIFFKVVPQSWPGLSDTRPIHARFSRRYPSEKNSGMRVKTGLLSLSGVVQSDPA